MRFSKNIANIFVSLKSYNVFLNEIFLAYASGAVSQTKILIYYFNPKVQRF